MTFFFFLRKKLNHNVEKSPIIQHTKIKTQKLKVIDRTAVAVLC